jgi:predicted dithiol-disulfide oxidoreductase (DUF899 family)
LNGILSVDPSTIWRWVQRYAPELNARIRHTLKPTNGSGRTDETYVRASGPSFSVFSRRHGIICHFYSAEITGAMADPGQDPRGGGPDLDPLWLMLDLTPEGRGTNWYPKLEYGHN